VPSVRKLAPEEVRGIENRGKGQRKLVEEQYDEFVRDYSLGDYGEADLSPEENRLTVRNRLKAAAGRRGLALEFRRTKGPVLRFRVVEPTEATSAATPPRARGPRKK
jgi:hypothetical protein